MRNVLYRKKNHVSDFSYFYFSSYGHFCTNNCQFSMNIFHENGSKNKERGGGETGRILTWDRDRIFFTKHRITFCHTSFARTYSTWVKMCDGVWIPSRLGCNFIETAIQRRCIETPVRPRFIFASERSEWKS